MANRVRLRGHPVAWLVLTGAGVGGCASTPYTPDALVRAPDGAAWPNARRAGECLDIAIWTVKSEETGQMALLHLAFGNRCDRTVAVDLRGLRVSATCGARTDIELSPNDPRHEIGPGRLAPHAEGWERIAYTSPACPTLPRTLCVDVARILPDAAATSTGFLEPQRSGSATTVCFPEGPDGSVERTGAQ
jgi:hypothetical protein